MLGRIVSQITICLLLLSPSSETLAARKDNARPNPSTASSAKNETPASTRIEQLERTLFWLGIICAIALMLPLPICLYHFRRVGLLMAEIEKLQSELCEQEALKAKLDSLLARNDKLEIEIKQLQENYRIRLLTAQEKHQEIIDKLKSDLRVLEVENKRLSGLILLKEQASKKL